MSNIKIESDIENHIKFENDFTNYFNWIKLDTSDLKYYKIKVDLIDKVYLNLESDHKKLLTTYLTMLINFIHNKFHFITEVESNLYWDQLLQNNLLDLRALLNMILPYISETDSFDSKKGALKSLKDLYLSKDSTGRFIYTNSQYNRCIRYLDNDKNILYMERPFDVIYFYHHFKLLLMSIEVISNKLYVNWIDVIPVRMDTYKEIGLYKETIKKISNPNNKFLLGYIDPNLGLSYGDIYNTIANHLYYQIVGQKWLIFDLPSKGKLIGMLEYLEKKINFKLIWDNNMWSHNTQVEKNKFNSEWIALKKSKEHLDRICIFYIYLAFSTNHRNRIKLEKQKLLITKRDLELQDEDDIIIDEKSLTNARIGIQNVPIDEIYLFFVDQLGIYKKSWYYYISNIKKTNEIDSFESASRKISITPKNFYNFAKSLVHYSDINTDSYIGFPRHWQTLTPDNINQIMDRLFNPNYTEKWFNISLYIQKAYGSDLSRDDSTLINVKMEELIKKHIIDVVFESLIYHGILSNFSPKKEITDIKLIDFTIGSKDENKRKFEQQIQIKKNILTEKNKKAYGEHGYYYVTGQSYNKIQPIKDKKYGSKSYFDCLITEQLWMFTYAMNWISQINFYHHYCNCRVIYVTGATGVGKSSEIPKILLYCTHMIDYKLDGKVICTIPRTGPVSDSAENVSKNMGVPILEYNSTYDRKVPTVNYVVQYKHKKKNHMDKGQTSFLRFVTDGTLLEEMKQSPFLTKSKPKEIFDKNNEKISWINEYSTGNKYDIIIVDEAHEHNTNMDLILTLMQNTSYINNSLKLIIISATMDDDEPIYRRYYRKINDNRSYPLSSFIAFNSLDRANIDRRVDISKPRETTQFKVTDHWLSKTESDKIDHKNYVDYGISKTIEVLNNTKSGHLLLFVAGKDDIKKCVKEINTKTPQNIICFPYHGELTDEQRVFVSKINETLPTYIESKDSSGKNVPPGTYKRAVIVATNAAEASITVSGLMYIVDTGYAKVNIYDPITQVENLITMVISYTSSTQRRGRVGRVAPGDVYYLYDKEKVFNNKTAYKIADENIRNTIVDLLKREPSDYPIITNKNNVNNLIMLDKLTQSPKRDKYVLYELFGNLGIYLDIIVKQYMLLDDTKPKDNKKRINDHYKKFYNYYGKGDIRSGNDSKYYKTNDYLINNHDDYHYQKDEDIDFRCHTGFDADILKDPSSKLDFYIIHPDENIIHRNPFTGKMVGIKNSLSVNESYYYAIAMHNGLLDYHINLKNINFNNFDLLKFDLFINDAKSLLFVIDTDADIFDKPSILLEMEDDKFITQKLIEYYEYINTEIYGKNTNTIVKTDTMDKINQAKQITIGKINALDNFNNLLWYFYSYGNELELDVLAICCLFSINTKFAKWMPNSFVPTAIKFIKTEQNNKGDIYFFWKLWIDIKKQLILYNMLDKLKIDKGTENQFMELKSQYIRKIPMQNVDRYLILDYMYKSGKLDTGDEFYFYVNLISIQEKDIIDIYPDQINSIAKYISDKIALNADVIKKFISNYLMTVAEVNRYTWIYKYEIENKLNDDAREDEIDITDWIKRKLRMNKIFVKNNINHIDNWNMILETYLRAYSPNLIKNEISHYITVRTGNVIDISEWSKKFMEENTLLNNKTKYIVYHSERLGNIYFLTPVKLKWIINLNPIYYYYFIKNSTDFINTFNPDDPILNKIREIISDVKNTFDQNQLLSYINQLDDKILSKVILHSLHKDQLKFQ